MQLKALLVTTLLVLPSVGFAQRGGGRTQSDRHTPLMDNTDLPKGPTLRVRDVEDMSPIKRLIDKRKDLKLSDAQITQLKDSETKLKQKNEPLLKSVDSLLHEIKQSMNSTSDEARAKGRDATIALHATLTEIGDNDDAAATEATGSFDADQQAKAKDILAKLKEDNESMLKDRLSMGKRDG
jgi:hypothetical protein